MLDILGIVFFGLMGLSIMVFIHELGHFIAAKSCGVGVEIFSLGWGNKLIGFERKGTVYQISWFPFGGFCKMKGELMKENWSDEDFQKAKSEDGTYLGSAWWKKMIISISGPLGNVLLALVVFSIMALIGNDIKTSSNKILLMSDISSNQGELRPADKAGLQSGDRILAIDDEEVTTFYEITSAITDRGGVEMVLKVDREGDIFELTIKPQYDEEAKRYLVGITEFIEPVVDKVMHGKPAEALGIQPGDRIVEINDHEINYAGDINKELFQQDTLIITVLRNGQTTELVQPNLKFDPETQELGIRFNSIVQRTQALNPVEAVMMGFTRTTNTFRLIIQSFALLFSGGVKNPTDVIAGPIRMTQMIGSETVSYFSLSFGEGISFFFELICILSIFIGVMNLLPIPALDGGQIVLAAILALGKEKIGLKFLYRYQMVGFSIVVILLFFAVFSDIFHFFT
ncbi:MAG: RIP metalloprotease RseP [Spirochaetales bacterium]|nr:RIP metalloprotease RseP [Spirochaetales bacterium]